MEPSPVGALPFVEAREVSKLYGRQRALWKVTVRLEPGRVTALLGPNGSGKTTLLSLFSTLTRPTSGTLHFGALPPERAGDARGTIGLLSHAPLVYLDLSARENVAFFARLHGVADAEREAEAQLVGLGLGDALDKPARAFSRGMLQRLGLARALVGRPRVVLLDEPFTGLDRKATTLVLDVIGRLRREGAMVLMISHDLETTAALADEAYVLRRGQVAAHHRGALDVSGLHALWQRATEAA